MDKSNLVSLVNRCYSIREVSKELCISYSTVRYWLKKYNLKTLRPETYGKYLCTCCGESNKSEFYGRRTKLCKSCDNKRVTSKSIDMRWKVIEHLGGECKCCGFNKSRHALEVHHLDPTIKDKNFKGYRVWSWERVCNEISGCVLLCRNCHAMVHSGELLI